MLRRYTNFCDITHATHLYLVRTEAQNHSHAHRSTVCGWHKGGNSQRGCCYAVTATSTEAGGPRVMQQHSSSNSKARKSTMWWSSSIEGAALRSSCRSIFLVYFPHNGIAGRPWDAEVSEVGRGFDSHLHPKIYEKKDTNSRLNQVSITCKTHTLQKILKWRDESNAIIAYCVQYRN